MKLKFAIACLIVVASVAVPFWIWLSTQKNFRDADESVQQQTEKIEKLSAENARLSNSISQARNPKSLSQTQLRELMKLRNEVGQLRRATNEVEQLRAKNQELAVAHAGSENKFSEIRANPNYFKKEQLVYSGYGDPASAVKTTLWAMRSGEISSYLLNFTPEAKARFENMLAGKSAEQIAALNQAIAKNLDLVTGFLVLDEKELSADAKVLNVFFDGENRNRKFILKKIGNEWKLHNIKEGSSNSE